MAKKKVELEAAVENKLEASEKNESMVAAAVNEVHELWMTVDSLLRELAIADKMPTWSQLTWFQQKMQWDQRKTLGQINRMKNVLLAQQVVGDEQSRAELEAAAAAASVECSARGEEIYREMEKLQAEQRTLETKRDSLLSRNEEVKMSLKRLRSDLLPESVSRSVSRSISAVKRYFVPLISEAEMPILQRKIFAAGPPAVNANHWFDDVRKHNPTWVQGRSQLTREFYDAVDGFEALNAIDQVEVDKLKAEFEAEKSMIQVANNFYA